MKDPYVEYHKAIQELNDVFWRQTKILWGSLAVFLVIEIALIAKYF